MCVLTVKNHIKLTRLCLFHSGDFARGAVLKWREITVKTKTEMQRQTDRVLKYYPNIHIWKNIYLVRMYTRKARKFSVWVIYRYKNTLEEEE